MSLAVIRVMKEHFARYGIPTPVVSDNSPQFISKEIESFSKSWNFENKTSDPGSGITEWFGALRNILLGGPFMFKSFPKYRQK